MRVPILCSPYWLRCPCRLGVKVETNRKEGGLGVLFGLVKNDEQVQARQKMLLLEICDHIGTATLNIGSSNHRMLPGTPMWSIPDRRSSLLEKQLLDLIQQRQSSLFSHCAVALPNPAARWSMNLPALCQLRRRKDGLYYSWPALFECDGSPWAAIELCPRRRRNIQVPCHKLTRTPILPIIEAGHSVILLSPLYRALSYHYNSLDVTFFSVSILFMFILFLSLDYL